ncbi:MAG: glycosyltransferase family 4 protein, partial [bacterium]|nr:glycosyltransferase family 4 protein [bacterium]
MGRVVRNVLKAWEEADVKHEIVLLAKSEKYLRALEKTAPQYRTALGSACSDLDATWFPWNRIDWKAENSAVTIHDMAPFVKGLPSSAADRSRFLRAAADSDHIITISDFSRDEIIKYAEVSPDKISVVLNGVESAFSPGDPARKESFLAERTGGRPYCLYVGNLEPRKGLALLLEAFASIADKVPHVLVVSDAPPSPVTLGARLEAIVNSHRRYEIKNKESIASRASALGDRLIWASRPEENLLIDYYRYCDLFIGPSIYEGFFLPMLEAMACGAPVAAARRASLPQVGGDVPVWFDPEDKASFAEALRQSLCRTDDELRFARENGLKRARELSWSKTGAGVMRVLENLAGSSYG